MENLTTASQGFGCFPFFLMNSVQSLFFGHKGREHQQAAFERNMQFRDSMKNLQDAFHREQVDAQIALRRESYELGRQYLIEQTLRENKSRKEQTNFADFCQSQNKPGTYWPLHTDIYAILSSRDDLIRCSSVVPLNVLIARTDVTSFKHNPNQTTGAAYRSFCDRVATELKELPNIKVEISPWKTQSQSSISDIYNINYILQGQPTLLVFPYLNKDHCLGIEMAAWSFNRGAQSMQQDKILHIANLPTDKLLLTAISAVKATIGMARDSYMLSEYRKALVYPGMVDEATLQCEEIRKTLGTYYSIMKKQIETNQDFRSLCTNTEWETISSSLKNTNLLLA